MADDLTLKVSRFAHPESSAVQDKFEICGDPEFLIEELDILIKDPMIARLLIERPRPAVERPLGIE